MKKAAFAILTVFAVAVMILSGLVLYERHCSGKFRETPLQIQEQQLRDTWGKPDEVAVVSGAKRLFYHTPLGKYIFTIDDSGRLSHKYSD